MAKQRISFNTKFQFVLIWLHSLMIEGPHLTTECCNINTIGQDIFDTILYIIYTINIIIIFMEKQQNKKTFNNGMDNMLENGN